ncbi:hypothetical protein RSJ44_004764 [Yersinia enterocolitica]|jgi:hypothetical protein|nr:hypothetical protein [Yersinia enterocolitica]ELI8408015.1 hypothetical protein [Yersinia enterocolitica]
MMNIEEMLRKKDGLNKRIEKVTRIIEEAGKGQTLSIYEYNRTEIRIDFPTEVLAPLLEKELARLNEKLQIILDAEQTAERVIAGLLTNQ